MTLTAPRFSKAAADRMLPAAYLTTAPSTSSAPNCFAFARPAHCAAGQPREARSRHVGTHTIAFDTVTVCHQTCL